jgi:hypothetical protein
VREPRKRLARAHFSGDAPAVVYRTAACRPLSFAGARDSGPGGLVPHEWLLPGLSGSRHSCRMHAPIGPGDQVLAGTERLPACRGGGLADSVNNLSVLRTAVKRCCQGCSALSAGAANSPERYQLDSSDPR